MHSERGKALVKKYKNKRKNKRSRQHRNWLTRYKDSMAVSDIIFQHPGGYGFRSPRAVARRAKRMKVI